MTRRLTIDIGEHVSETSCIAGTLDDGCCPWLRVGHGLNKWACGLFEGSSVTQLDPRKPLRRLPECVAAEVKP